MSTVEKKILQIHGLTFGGKRTPQSGGWGGPGAPLCKAVGLGSVYKNVSQDFQEAMLALGRWEVRDSSAVLGLVLAA